MQKNYDEVLEEDYKNENMDAGVEAAGTVYGNVSNASTIYGTDKFSTIGGHGFAAERANHLFDTVTGHSTELVGDNNIKNGADRIVDGISIQSKYCASGSKCISGCFEHGKLRYINADGSPMQIEVPSDKYEAAVQAMEKRIENGEVPGVTDPNEAKNIVRKGHFTYKQAKNIAKAGTVESISFDAVNGAIVATSALGISAALSFATSIWNGNEIDDAIQVATNTGLKVWGTTFATSIIASQLSKAGLNSVLVNSSEAIAKLMGPKVSALLVNAFRSGANIYGAAAMKVAAKMLRGNVITGTASVVVLSSVDIVNIFQGRISGKQLFKNLANTTSTVAGGTAGWIGGAAAGAAIGSVVPIIGNVAGGVIGGILGSFGVGAAANKVSNAVLGEFIEDDAEEMINIIQKVFEKMSQDYLLTESEAENIIDMLSDDLTGATLKDMYASDNRKKFAKKLLSGKVKSEVKKRKYIKLPELDQIQDCLKVTLEEIAEEMAV